MRDILVSKCDPAAMFGMLLLVLHFDDSDDVLQEVPAAGAGARGWRTSAEQPCACLLAH